MRCCPISQNTSPCSGGWNSSFPWAQFPLSLVNQQNLNMTQIFLFYCFSQILLIGGRNPMEDVEKFKEHGWVVFQCLRAVVFSLSGVSAQSCGPAAMGWCCQNLLGWAGELWDLPLEWGEALMCHQHHLSAVWLKNRAEKCLQWIFHFSPLINFLKLLGADTDGGVLKESCLPMAFAWRYQIFPVADSCFPYLLSILSSLNCFCHRGCPFTWAFPPIPSIWQAQKYGCS